MLTLASASASNMVDATPSWVSMPAPTMEILATLLSQDIFFAPTISQYSCSAATASSPSSDGTVKVMSLVPSRPTDCRMISTLMCALATREKILNAMPGSSGRPMMVTRATLVSLATPLISIFSILVTSLTLVPGTGFRLDSTSSSTLYFLAISTERLFKTCAPSVASSSISS